MAELVCTECSASTVDGVGWRAELAPDEVVCEGCLEGVGRSRSARAIR